MTASLLDFTSAHSRLEESVAENSRIEIVLRLLCKLHLGMTNAYYWFYLNAMYPNPLSLSNR